MDITSKTDICNLALDLLSAGTVRDIENPTDPTEEIMARWYDQSRRKVLREHPWNFATKRAALSASETPPPFGYSAQYPVPADFVRLLLINYTDNEMDTPAPSTLYKLEGRNILTGSGIADGGVLNIKYVYDFETVSQFDPMFIDLLAYEIAVSVAYKISQSNTNIERIAQLHKTRAAMAKAIDGQESPPILVERSRNRTLRKYGLSGNTSRINF